MNTTDSFVPDDHLTGYPIALNDMEMQSRWEAKQVDEGVKRYRKAIADAALSRRASRDRGGGSVTVGSNLR